MSKFQRLLLGLSCLLVFSNSIKAQLMVGNTTIDTTTIIGGLSTPWEIIYGPDDHIYFTERIGKINRIDPSTGINKVILDYTSTVNQYGEGGLLGMVLHPNFPTTPKIYAVYNYGTNSSVKERLVSFDYNITQEILTNEVILLDSIPGAVNHNGSRLLIENGFIYMTTGDAANTSTAQNIRSLNGKVLRLNLDGSIPNDNPLANSPIWSWGHRNPQGLFFANDFLYSSEHGPNNDDEINIIQKGRNYGWPDVEGFCNTPNEQSFCADSNVVEPLYAWTPTVATSDILYYDHPAIPEFQNSLLLTTLKDATLHQLPLNTTKDAIITDNEFFANFWGRLRDIAVGPNGELYIATNSGSHSIVRIKNPNYTNIPKNSLGNEALNVFPIPSDNSVTVELNPNIQFSSYQLYNLEGQLVQEDTINGNILTIYRKSEYEGVYFLKVKTSESAYTRKVIFK